MSDARIEAATQEIVALALQHARKIEPQDALALACVLLTSALGKSYRDGLREAARLNGDSDFPVREIERATSQVGMNFRSVLTAERGKP